MSDDPAAVPPPRPLRRRLPVDHGGGHNLAVVLHDVAPARWAACLRVLAQLRTLAREAGVAELPVTLLVVPEFHGEPTTPAFVRWLRRQSREGHELALHGFTHRDEAAPAGGWLDHARRRWYTAGEGEFASLDRAGADHRLALGRAWAATHGLTMPGFVAPAWLLNDAGWDAVQAAGFRYTCTLTQVVALSGLPGPSERRPLHARSIVFSTRSWWRRPVSVAWNTALSVAQRGAPLLRFELHPDDADFPAVLRCWSRLLAGALRDGRRPLRLLEVAERAAQRHGTPPATAVA